MDKSTPKNLQELLKFAIQQQQGNESDNVQLDEDKKIFLDQVLQTMSVNVTEEFLKAINILQGTSSDQDKAEALGVIRDYIDNIDFANSFIKIEGADILRTCVEHKNHQICINATNIVAEMCQNNETCQTYFHTEDIIILLKNYLGSDDQNLVASALYALSALIDNNLPALTDFLQFGGIDMTIKCLNAESSRIFSRACSLIVAMCSEFALVQDEFAKRDVVNKLAKKLRVVDSFDAEIEMVLRAISLLIRSRQCELNNAEVKYITDTLQAIEKKNENLPECEEIVKFSKYILERLDSF